MVALGKTAWRNPSYKPRNKMERKLKASYGALSTSSSLPRGVKLNPKLLDKVVTNYAKTGQLPKATLKNTSKVREVKASRRAKISADIPRNKKGAPYSTAQARKLINKKRIQEAEGRRSMRRFNEIKNKGKQPSSLSVSVGKSLLKSRLKDKFKRKRATRN